MIEAGIRFPKTHDFAALLTLLSVVEPTWEPLRGDLDALTDRAVEVRYPGYSADADDAREAVRIAAEVRRLARGVLDLGAG